MAERKNTPGFALLLACVPCVVSTLVFLASLFFGLVGQCDESCTGDGWRHTEGAWQWNVIPLFGAVALAGGAWLLICVRRRRPGSAVAALLVGTFAALVAISGLTPISHEELTRHPKTVGIGAVIFFAGLIAALLSAPGEPDGEVRARTD